MGDVDPGQHRFELENRMLGKSRSSSRVKKNFHPTFKKIRRFSGPFLFVFLLLIIRLSGYHEYLTLSTLNEHYTEMKLYTSRHPIFSAFLYLLTYFIVVTLTIPGATALTILSGTLFNQPLGFFCAIFGATLGACGCFLFVKVTLVPSIKDVFHLDKCASSKNVSSKSSQDPLCIAREWLDVNSISSLVVSLTFLRIVPILPFFAVNMACALLGVNLKMFGISTLIGCIPGGLLYSSVGKILGDILEKGSKKDKNEEIFSFVPSRILWESLNEPLIFRSVVFCLLWVFTLIPLKLFLKSKQHNTSKDKNE